MLKRLAMIALLLLAAARADALEYTDVYFDPAEPGWGAFLVQSNATQFIAFFIYDSQGKPTWYVAVLTDDGTGKYTGPLYATTGTYFLVPWQGYNLNPAGNVSFAPSDRYHATLTYTVNGAGTVTKPVQRQTLASYVMGGNYSGSMSGSITGCNNPASNDPAFRGRYGLAVTQTGDDSATLTFTFTDANHAGIVCSVSGPLTHFGRLYQMANVALNCTTGNSFGTLDALHPTGQGIEGQWTSHDGGGCNVSLHFSAVLNVNN
jgi:hypothetical protein